MWKKQILQKKKPALWVAVSYVIFGVLWILFSDTLVAMLVEDPMLLTRVQTYKGWGFVMGSGALIYFIMSWILHDLRQAKLNILENESLQHDFLNRHYQPIWQTDIYGHCIFYNDKWIEFTGYPIPKDKPLSWIEIIHTDDKPLYIDKFSQGLINKDTFSLEYRILDKDGNYRWVFNSCIPRFGNDKKFQGIIGFLFDIDEKKQLTEKYKNSSRRYGYLFDNNPHSMMVYDLQDLRILEVNKAAQYQYGYSEEEMLNLTLLDLRPASEIPAFLSQMADSMPDYQRSSGWLHKRKDGSVFNAEIIAHSLPEAGNRKTRLVLVMDITEQVETFKTAKEGQRRFAKIFDYSPYAILILDDNLMIKQANASASRILGSLPASLNMGGFPDIVADSSKETMLAEMEKLTQQNHILGEADFVRQSGEQFHVEYHAVSFQESGKLNYYFSFNDIDQKFKTQQALRESESINATLVSNLPGMAFRCLTDKKWTMLFISSGVEKLTGYRPYEVLNNNRIAYEEIIYDEDRRHVRDEVEKGLSKNQKYQVRYRIKSKEGKLIWVWEQSHGVFNEKNELKYIEGFILDITKEIDAMQEAEFQSYFLRLIVDNIPFPLFYKDVKGVYTGCNNSFCEYLGMPREEIIGKTVYDIFEKSQADVFHEKDQELYELGSSQSYQTNVRFPDGRLMDAVFHKIVFHDHNGKTLGIIGLYFDITKRVEAEKVIRQQMDELERINSELERFSYSVSHDLRSPLVTIKGFLGLLKEDLKEGNQQDVDENIMRIENATDKMQDLLEDLLHLSRVGRIVNPYEEFSMTTVAYEVKELLFGVIREKGCEIIIDEEMPEVYADKSRTRELYQNLIENAIKFSVNEQKPVIKIYHRNEDDKAVFCVEDNGIGIPEAYHDKIFGLFNKLDTNSPGTGVGLSLVKNIVENHNGKVWVESQGHNKGSVFCFTLNTQA